MLVGGAGHRGADGRVGQRIDRRVGIAGLRSRVSSRARRPAGSPRSARCGWCAWPLVPARGEPAAKFERHRADMLGDDLRAALHRDGEDGQHDLPRRPASRRGGDHVEGRGAERCRRYLGAGGAKIGDGGDHVDRARVAAGPAGSNRVTSPVAAGIGDLRAAGAGDINAASFGELPVGGSAGTASKRAEAMRASRGPARLRDDRGAGS